MKKKTFSVAVYCLKCILFMIFNLDPLPNKISTTLLLSKVNLAMIL